MTLLQRLAGSARREPRGTLRVVDPNPLNWLYITYNTVEEPVRVTRRGKVRPAAMSSYRWRGSRTMEIRVRPGGRFADGTSLDACSVHRSFTEQTRWHSPHPPGTHFNIDPRTRAEVVDERTVRLHLPEPDGLVLGKLRATHVMSERFWRDLGFGYARDETGEGHW
ncbi:ABC transporter substrate-binding protein [Blastococcus capsensis]|uniref:ABC transporter substrate-binding protein n=1 Tax=Blastococcus capsensis TaxID=1564163 RepID=UPI0025407439|nr:ABC transporter substrate-binding protein [Blastococcus capsensis]MDK3256852.1 ABC transporter substrate-binding protein [Blastococcus capsensis]